MDVSLESVPRKSLLSEKVSSLPSVQRSYISDNELVGGQDLASEGAPAIDKTILVNVKPKLISGHETHMGLETRTY
jgi:hypothetical protein